MPDQPAYLDLLDQLNEALRKERSPALCRAGMAEIESFLPKVRRSLGADLPPEYALFLHEANGFAYGGTRFYSLDQSEQPGQEIPGLIARNRVWNAVFKTRTPYLILGESDLWLYAHHPATHTFHALWKDRHDSIEQFTDFSEMMENALKEALGIPLDEGMEVELL